MRDKGSQAEKPIVPAEHHVKPKQWFSDPTEDDDDDDPDTPGAQRLLKEPSSIADISQDKFWGFLRSMTGE